MLIPFSFYMCLYYTIQLLTQDQCGCAGFRPFYISSFLKVLSCKARQGFEGKVPASFSCTCLIKEKFKEWGVRIKRKANLD